MKNIPYNDFAYFKKWCKQNGYKESNANLLSKFTKGLPLWEDMDGNLFLDSEIDAVNQGDYYYDNNAFSESNQEKYECTIEMRLE